MKALLFISMLLGFTSLVFGQQKLGAKRVTIYKSGIAHVIKQGDLQFKDNIALLSGPINPLIGTYWLSGDNKMSIQFRTDTVKVKREVADFIGLINANVGKSVKLIYVYKSLEGAKQQEISGEILKYYPATQMLKFRSKGETPEFVNLSQMQILNLSLSGEENDTYTQDSVYRVTKIYSDKDQLTQDVELHYVGTGFTWLPSYYLQLVDNDKARLEMKALIENFAEPLENVETEVVVGSPNLAFGATLDPITNYNYSSSSFDQRMFGDVRGTRSNFSLTPGITSNAFGTNTNGGGADGRGYFEQTYETEGEKSFDLFRYKLGKISIPENTKAYFPIFAQKLPYEEIYEGIIPDYTSFASSYYVRRDEQTIDVSHSIKLKNETNYPLTTASIVIEDHDQKFLAQDRVLYTPTKGDVNIKLSKAIDVIMKNREEEVSRDINYRKINDVKFGQATIKGYVTVHNYQKKAIKVDVKKYITGDANEVKGAKIEKNPTGSVNQASTISWEVKLEPGEKKELTYEYNVLFVPR